ncbi:MAG: hypothetical protein GTO55_11710 [Armatimonadetes bacterium]|nr:hypothetical protein [Armatimonadota bacterium]NIM24883.1 hypothetical protein [Armatimonadota bacterium]NIM68772.1 hypothetical protein [Armatimonadota bacterium]NIM77034.1 hypothetical protein [Armatimonadota bacterium]NIN06969.1 hypothetical protein [Armatimonadota bacterium]
MSRGVMGLVAGLVVGIILGLVLASTIPQASAAPSATDGGRYQLMEYTSGKLLLLLDTDTGRVWKHSTMAGGFKPVTVFGLHE